MKNYAGHRLAPWLSHLMVSRQETARPLLTPGEVMQLPATDEIVMIAGLPPIRARKLRYYEEKAFAARLLPAPALAAAKYADRPPLRPDDWSAAPPITAPAFSAELATEDPANGGIRPEPELPVHEEVVLPPAPADEFAFAEDEADDEPQRQRVLARLQTQLTRAAAVDRDDGLGMGM